MVLKKVDSGANVGFFIPYDDGAFYGTRKLSGVQVASAVQVYLDVRNFRGRGEEAAEVFLDHVIRQAWEPKRTILKIGQSQAKKVFF